MGKVQAASIGAGTLVVGHLEPDPVLGGVDGTLHSLYLGLGALLDDLCKRRRRGGQCRTADPNSVTRRSFRLLKPAQIGKCLSKVVERRGHRPITAVFPQELKISQGGHAPRIGSSTQNDFPALVDRRARRCGASPPAIRSAGCLRGPADRPAPSVKRPSRQRRRHSTPWLARSARTIDGGRRMAPPVGQRSGGSEAHGNHGFAKRCSRIRAGRCREYCRRHGRRRNRRRAEDEYQHQRRQQAACRESQHGNKTDIVLEPHSRCIGHRMKAVVSPKGLARGATAAAVMFAALLAPAVWVKLTSPACLKAA